MSTIEHRSPAAPTPLLASVRLWFSIDVAVLAVAGVQCFVLANETDRWFAWTVSPPISASVLGAGYFGSIVMVVGARLARRWVDARVVLVSTFVFAALTLAVTLVHLDKFHFDKGGTAARAAAIAWLVVYVVVPPLALWLIALQLRAGGSTPPRTSLSPPLVGRVVLLVEGVAMFAVGLVLFVGAGAAEFWPWTLTDLTARAIGAWLVALGFMLGMCVWERELVRIEAPLLSVAAASALWIAGMVRFRDSIRWGSAGAVMLAAPVVLIVTVAAIVGLPRYGRRVAVSAAASAT